MVWWYGAWYGTSTSMVPYQQQGHPCCKNISNPDIFDRKTRQKRSVCPSSLTKNSPHLFERIFLHSRDRHKRAVDISLSLCVTTETLLHRNKALLGLEKLTMRRSLVILVAGLGPASAFAPPPSFAAHLQSRRADTPSIGTKDRPSAGACRTKPVSLSASTPESAHPPANTASTQQNDAQTTPMHESGTASMSSTPFSFPPLRPHAKKHPFVSPMAAFVDDAFAKVHPSQVKETMPPAQPRHSFVLQPQDVPFDMWRHRQVLSWHLQPPTASTLTVVADWEGHAAPVVLEDVSTEGAPALESAVEETPSEAAVADAVVEEPKVAGTVEPEIIVTEEPVVEFAALEPVMNVQEPAVVCEEIIQEPTVEVETSLEPPAIVQEPIMEAEATLDTEVSTEEPTIVAVNDIPLMESEEEDILETMAAAVDDLIDTLDAGDPIVSEDADVVETAVESDDVTEAMNIMEPIRVEEEVTTEDIEVNVSIDETPDFSIEEIPESGATVVSETMRIDSAAEEKQNDDEDDGDNDDSESINEAIELRETTGEAAEAEEVLVAAAIEEKAESALEPSKSKSKTEDSDLVDLLAFGGLATVGMMGVSSLIGVEVGTMVDLALVAMAANAFANAGNFVKEAKAASAKVTPELPEDPVGKMEPFFTAYDSESETKMAQDGDDKKVH